ncbi:hypothetical protein [uncultured Schumannella sp.]|uniref:hypothetical protein n=1 Tax=uncultured Schumannella sp. TaxID=1195956 RepID=UPI0025F05947|nr:hypothetical protein [uncultured Schumannella sp.]
MGNLVKNLPWQNGENWRRAEADAASMLSEDERAADFRANLPNLIAEEKAQIDAALAEGRTLVANKVDYTYVIHRSNCFAIRHQMDRDEAWTRYDDDPRGVSHSYEMPNLLAPEEVEALEVYRACLTCNPDTTRRIKKREHSLRPTALRNIARRHLGRDFESIDGEPLGELIAYTVASDSVTLHFASGDRVDSEYPEVVMLPLASA